MDIPVTDPFRITNDEKMPFLSRALDPSQVQRQIDRHLKLGANGAQAIRLSAIRVTRYKPGRRCLLEYDVETRGGRDGTRIETYLGKARARGLDRSSYEVLQSLWQHGFSDTCPDGISVPEPVGLIPEFQMWLQRKMPGVTAAGGLMGSEGVALARRIAEAAHKLHRCGIAPRRTHRLSDELGILSERLERVSRSNSAWKKRLNRILEACAGLVSATPAPPSAGIHRDFYSEQILREGSRLFLLDLDLYSEGDPALDIGNFIGHLTEYSLRTLGDADGLQDREQAIEDRFAELAGESTRARVRSFALLTLVRHIYLSTQFPERQPFTEPILELCEKRLATQLV